MHATYFAHFIPPDPSILVFGGAQAHDGMLKQREIEKHNN